MIEKLMESIFSGVLANFIHDKLKSVKTPPDTKEKKTIDDRKQPYGKKSVPQNIQFGTTLLLTPSLEELKIPPPFACLPHINCHVNGGDWVDRGDLLVTYSFVYYQAAKQPPFLFRLFLGDWLHTQTFELHSPVSGFVTDLRRILCRDSGMGNFGGSFIAMLDEYSVLPTLLVPRDEPAWNNYNLDRFAARICSSIVRNWKLNRHNPGGGENAYKKLRLQSAIKKEAFWSYNEKEKEELSEAISWVKSEPCSRRSGEISWVTCGYQEYQTSWGTTLDEYIEFYRSQDLALRDKLVHLIHASNNKT